MWIVSNFNSISNWKEKYLKITWQQNKGKRTKEDREKQSKNKEDNNKTRQLFHTVMTA